jgi:hypothetical protein
LKILFPQKLPDVGFTNPISTVGTAAIAEPLMLRCINDGVTAIKPGHQLETAGNACVIW